MHARRITTASLVVSLLVATGASRVAAAPARVVPANFVWHGVAGNYIPLREIPAP